MNIGTNDEATEFYNLQPFAIMVGGQVVVYPSQPHVLIIKLFQPSYNCVIPAVNELSEIL